MKHLQIKWKITVLVSMLLAFATVVGGTSIFFMNQIGGEIEEIAERNIPLTEKLTEATIHQLEQAIVFERAAREGLLAVNDRHAAEKFQADVVAFDQLSEKVEGEIREAEAMVEEAIAATHREEAKAELAAALDTLKTIEAEHKDYDTHVHEAFALYQSGNLAAATELTEEIDAEQTKLDHALEALLMKVEAFTHASATLAESHEKFALSAIIAVLAIALVLGAGLATLMASMIVRPLRMCVGTVEALADGDTSVQIDYESRDEVGILAKSIEVFRQNTIKANELSKQQEIEKQRQLDRAARVDELTQEFDKAVSAALSTVASATTELNSSAESMSTTATQTNSQATSVAAASEQAAVNIQTVASAAEELANSIGEIGRQVNESTQVAAKAEKDAEATNKRVSGLADAANRIGEVVELISGIAEQTNLLALNATIEAARAGEAGKGFAVVASEVKGLAQQTAQATEQVSEQISAIQTETRHAVEAIGTITGTVRQINTVAAAIAAAVEEQGAATEEIARNVEQAANGTNEVSSNITGVTAAAGHAAEASNNVVTASTDLSKQSESLKGSVERFITEVRAA